MKKKDLQDLDPVKRRSFKTIHKEVELRPWDSPDLNLAADQSNPGEPEIQSLVRKEPLANGEQSVSIPTAELLAICDQSVSIVLAKESTKMESVSKASPKPLAQPLAQREQSESKPLAIIDTDGLVGKERALLLFVFKRCQALGARETSLITTEEMREALKVSAERLRNLIYRLGQKGCLTVSEIKNGRAGWRKFQLPGDLFQQLYLKDSVSNPLSIREQSVSIATAEALAEPLASAPSSSSLIKIRTTTEDWEPFKKFKEELGFSQHHLEQVLNDGVLNTDQVKASLEAFNFDLKRGAIKVRKSPLEFIMGVLRRQKSPYISEFYKDEETVLLEALEQRLNERKKQLRQKKHSAFQSWLELEKAENEAQLLVLVPPVGSRYGSLHQELLLKFFEEKILRHPDTQ